MAMIIVSAIISAITSKIVATYYFEKADGYVKEMCEMTKKSNQHTLAILHKLQKILSQRSEISKIFVNSSYFRSITTAGF